MYDEDSEEVELVTSENAASKLKEDSVAVVIKPSFNNDSWTGKVDLSALIMPVTRLTDDEHDLIKDTMYALVTCFHLLNTDQDFANRVSEEMDKMAESGELQNLKKKKDITHLSSWTKTQGNA